QTSYGYPKYPSPHPDPNSPRESLHHSLPTNPKKDRYFVPLTCMPFRYSRYLSVHSVSLLLLKPLHPDENRFLPPYHSDWPPLWPCCLPGQHPSATAHSIPSGCHLHICPSRGSGIFR